MQSSRRSVAGLSVPSASLVTPSQVRMFKMSATAWAGKRSYGAKWFSTASVSTRAGGARSGSATQGLLRAAMGSLTLLVCIASGGAWARCPNPDEVMAVAAAYFSKTPAEPIAALRGERDAYCAQGLVAAEIGRSMGTIVGYKAAFTSDRVRTQFGSEGPHRGFLYEKMFLKDGATVNARFGARPQVVADLILVIKDYRIHDALTPLEVLNHVSHVVPFIELSDLIWNTADNTTALEMVAANMGTRMGVLGTPIPVQATQTFLDGLAEMVVVMRDQDGNELGRAPGSDVLGNPIAAVQWLAKELAHNGQRIQMDDRVSVGAFFPATTPVQGMVVTVQYQGLPGDPSVAVRFR